MAEIAESQRPSAGATTSRDLLLTVLGELVLPNEQSAWTQTLVAAMELLDVREKATRQALARLDERGWLARTRHGRQTRWHLTDPSIVLLQSGAERIYGFGEPGRSWNGTWVVLFARVPETNRRARNRLGVGLRWTGFGSLGQGTWISPWPDREHHAVELITDLGIEATSFHAELGQLGSAKALAAQAWDLPAIRADYDRFVSATTPSTSSVGADAVAGLTGLVHQWRRFPLLDPDLPAELLPADWPGQAAATHFRDQRAQLIRPATEWWTTTDDTFSPPSSG